MNIHSTSKMLAKMQGKKRPNRSEIIEHEQSEDHAVPQLRLNAEPEPKADMQNVLANMLGTSPSKKHSPMD